MNRTFGLLVIGVILAAAPVPSLAQSGGGGAGSGQAGYDLGWWTVDGGGQVRTPGSTYALEGTIGQPDVGVLVTEKYALAGGFWGSSAGSAQNDLFLPLVLRSA